MSDSHEFPNFWKKHGKDIRAEVYGILRVTRRPELMAVIALAAGAGLASTTAAQVCTFGIGPAVSLGLLALHADRAQLKTGDLSATKFAQTSLVR